MGGGQRRERGRKTRDRIEEREREANLRKETQKSCIRNVGNGGDLGSVQRLRGEECNKFVPVLRGDGTKIAPTGDIFDQPSGGMS